MSGRRTSPPGPPADNPGVSGVALTVSAAVAEAAAADAGGVPVDLLADFLPVLSAAVAAGEPVPAPRLRVYRGRGERAARAGVALRALLDLYLSAAWRLWPELPQVRAAADNPPGVVRAGEVMLHAVDDVVAALTEGFQLARRALVRAQEAARREFVDDLLGGTGDVAGLLHRAAGFGMDLAGPHAVATVHAAREFDDGQPLITELERAISGRKADAVALLASKQGRLVVVFAAPDAAAVAQVRERLVDTLRRAEFTRHGVGDWQIGLGRPGVGADGVLSAYRESLDALDAAARLGLGREVVDARDVLVYTVLLRDRGALDDLVEATLGPLRAARGGAAALIDTLAAYYDAGSSVAGAARALHLSPRAVSYRLARIRELTGLDVDDREDRRTLQIAALGARLLDRHTD